MPADSFFDTSILMYALAQRDRRSDAVDKLLLSGGYISVQVLNELVAVARRKLHMHWEDILAATAAIRSLCEAPVALTVAMHDEALRISQRYKYHIYDSLVIAAALEAGCAVLYSEDMQDGQLIESIRIRNPFRGF
jgi:predicted nucleic acid-binding protein